MENSQLYLVANKTFSSKIPKSFWKTAYAPWMELKETHACFWPCPRCGREAQWLPEMTAFYPGTNLKIALLHKTDLHGYYRDNPICEICLARWVDLHCPRLIRQLTTAIGKLQKWWRWNLYTPPCPTKPYGGRKFRFAQISFYQDRVTAMEN